MRAIFIGIAIALGASGSAHGQTAPFKCGKPGLVVEYDDDSRTEWIGADADHCRINHKSRTEEARLMDWYAPMASVPLNASRSWFDQMKPQRLWPLSVGKKISARYDGAARIGAYHGSWMFSYTVDKYERITTKAGTFDAFVITRLQDRIDGYFKEKWISWYTPEPGVVVRSDYWNNQGSTNKADAVTIRGQ